MDYFNSVNIEFYKIDKFGYIIYNQPKNQGKLISFAPLQPWKCFCFQTLESYSRRNRQDPREDTERYSLFAWV